MKKSILLLTFFAALFFSSCKDDIQNIDSSFEYNTSLGLPIGKANFNIADILIFLPHCLSGDFFI